MSLRTVWARRWVLCLSAWSLGGAVACGGSDPAPPTYPAQPPPVASGGDAQPAAAPAASGGHAQPAAASMGGVPDPRAWLLSLGIPVPPNCRVEGAVSSRRMAILRCGRGNDLQFVFQRLDPGSERAMVQTFGVRLAETLRSKGIVLESFGQIPCTLPGGIRGQCSIANSDLNGAKLRILLGYVGAAPQPAVVVCMQVATQPGAIPPCPLLP